MQTENGISSSTRENAWYDFIDAERMVRYTESLHSRYLTWHLIFTVLLVVFGISVSCLSFIEQVNNFLVTAICIAITIISVLQYIFNFARKAAIIYNLDIQLKTIRNDYGNLWLQIENKQITEAEAFSRIQALKANCEDAKKGIGDQDMRPSDRLNKKAQEDAISVFRARYGVS